MSSDTLVKMLIDMGHQDPNSLVSLPTAMAAPAATGGPGATLSLNKLLPKGCVPKTEKELEDAGPSCCP